MDDYKFYSYIDDKSILVITPKNKLVRIKCPFAVKDSEGKIYQVDSVAERNQEIQFLINTEYQLYRNFQILY